MYYVPFVILLEVLCYVNELLPRLGNVASVDKRNANYGQLASKIKNMILPFIFVPASILRNFGRYASWLLMVHLRGPRNTPRTAVVGPIDLPKK